MHVYIHACAYHTYVCMQCIHVRHVHNGSHSHTRIHTHSNCEMSLTGVSRFLLNLRIRVHKNGQEDVELPTNKCQRRYFLYLAILFGIRTNMIESEF
jgi:hypothetical protein